MSFSRSLRCGVKKGYSVNSAAAITSKETKRWFHRTFLHRLIADQRIDHVDNLIVNRIYDICSIFRLVIGLKNTVRSLVNVFPAFFCSRDVVELHELIQFSVY